MVGNPDLRIMLRGLSQFVLPVICACVLVGRAFSQEEEVGRSAGLVVAITGRIGERPVFGAGIVLRFRFSKAERQTAVWRMSRFPLAEPLRANVYRPVRRSLNA